MPVYVLRFRWPFRAAAARVDTEVVFQLLNTRGHPPSSPPPPTHLRRLDGVSSLPLRVEDATGPGDDNRLVGGQTIVYLRVRAREFRLYYVIFRHRASR